MPRRMLIVAGMTSVFVFVGGGANAAAPTGDDARDVPIAGTTLEQAHGGPTVSGPCQVDGRE